MILELQDHYRWDSVHQMFVLLERLRPVGSMVTLAPETTQPLVDRCERLLRYVGPDGVDVGHKLLRRGAAERYRNRPPITRSGDYDSALDRDKSEPVGFWKCC